jgi:hypothetical protein
MNQILSALFFILLSSFFHHISSFLTTRAPPAHSGVSYESIPSSTSFSSSPSIATSINDITLIGTVGGYLHAVNTITLEKIWSVNIGGPLLSAQELSTNLDYSMVPMIDGSLLYRGNKGVRATSVTAKTLIENTPFHAQDGLLYNGEKFSKLYEIDLTNGQLLNDFSSPSTTSESPLKSPETSSVIVGRVDYILRAYNTETGQQEVNLFFLYFSQFYPLSLPLVSSTSLMVSSLQSLVAVTVSQAMKAIQPPQISQRDQNSHILPTLRTSLSVNAVPQSQLQQLSFTAPA